MDHQQNTQKDVRQLNSFLRGELSAVETYDQALNKIDQVALAEQLSEVRASHEQRAAMLRQRITQLGGDPANSSGVWGSFAKLVEGGATVFGTSSAIAALEEGEDHGLDDYRADMQELTPDTQTFLSKRILPEQAKTHDVMSSLKHEIKKNDSSNAEA